MDFPYGRLQDAYLNVKEAAKEPWRGITAWVQGDPWLIIDKTDDVYTLENEQGEIYTTDVFERWQSATEHSALVAASRLEDSPFAAGRKAGNQDIGNLIYFEGEWDVRLANLDVSLPIESLVERYDRIRWSKTADLYPGMDYRCPDCGSRDVSPSAGWDHSIYECENCGKQGYEEEFENEAPDDHEHADEGFYPDWTGSAKTAASFDYPLPPAGIHMRTHAAMAQAGLHAVVHFPPGLEGMFGPIPETLEVPSRDQQSVMAVMMLDNPEQYTVHVDTPDDPNQVRQIFDQAGGRREGKIANGEGPEGEPTVDQKKALTCPRCGSHTLRAFSPEGSKTTLVCLTCGNEFARSVHMNPESSVKNAVSPLDPSISAQVIGLMQQIEDAYKRNDTQAAQQLHQQMMQLMQNPNQPITNQPLMSSTKEGYGAPPPAPAVGTPAVSPNTPGTGTPGPQYPGEPAKQAQITALMQQISDVAKQGDINSLRLLQQRLESLLGGNPAYARRQAGDFPVRPDEVENVGDTRLLSYTMPGGDRASLTVHAENLVMAIKDLVDRGAVDIHIGGERDDTPGDLRLPQSWGKVDNSTLASTPEEFNLDSMTFKAQSWYEGSDPYSGQPVNLDDYTQSGEDPTMDSNIDYMHCPACDGPGVLLGQLGQKIHYRCRNCGIDFNEHIDPNHTGPERTEPYGADTSQGISPYGSFEEAEDVNQHTLKAFKDSSGNLIEAGKLYMLHHPKYKVPDVVKILNLENDRIEASIASDEHGAFPIHIRHDDAYSLDPYESRHKSAGTKFVCPKCGRDRTEDDLSGEGRACPKCGFEATKDGEKQVIEKKASGWNIIARRNFTAQEQRELIEENLEGRARNFDKLDLSGTHYQIKEEANIPEFLLGW